MRAPLVDYMALEMTKVLDGLEVRPERMIANSQVGGGVVFSQRVLLALVESGMSREDAYLVVQKAAMQADGGRRRWIPDSCWRTNPK